MNTLAQFIAMAQLSMTAERTDSNPNMDDPRSMDHWKCILRIGRRRVTIRFSQGYGHNGRVPELSSVLSCLASDSVGIENARGFEDWASDYGYDTDSRKAEKTYNACQQNADRLKTFLGSDLYKQLLWETEDE